jgi:hypothetical protein
MEIKMKVHRDSDEVLSGELQNPTTEDANLDLLPPPKDVSG